MSKKITQDFDEHVTDTVQAFFFKTLVKVSVALMAIYGVYNLALLVRT